MKIKETIQNWDKDCEKLTRITVTSIGRKVNLLSLIEKKQDKLPKTMNYIKKVVEDVESYQMRRVEFIIKKMTEEQQPLMKWEIYKQAGLNPNVSNEVKRFITMKLS